VGKEDKKDKKNKIKCTKNGCTQPGCKHKFKKAADKKEETGTPPVNGHSPDAIEKIDPPKP